ncbi:hypothetical protein [Curtobacterium sp. MCBD17_021]|uniref:hypothetical protein n=1 Tax=Curtobacterium sp. MCBD17_021 TaxID=2175665 RepID=UPI000DA79B2F|nr:hypothetical protein [Curtobacterium sp. MCBD17_021]PZE62689.1 hypothetical protein DEI83_14860 [Curtobacterium sp. MCBD17_021]
MTTYEATSAKHQTRPAAYAWLAMLLGGGTMVLALVEPQQDGVSTGFVASTIGITAMVVGTHAVRIARWGSATVRAFGRGGAVLGAVGTALMAYAMIAFLLGMTGIALPALSLPIADPGRGPAAVAATTAPVDRSSEDRTTEQEAAAAAAVPADPESDAVTGVPSAALPTSADEERNGLAQTAGTLAFVMRERFGAGPFPPTLVVSTGDDAAVRLLDGTVLAAVPPGAQLTYSVAPDAAAWAVTLHGSQFQTTASFNSSVGTVEVG